MKMANAYANAYAAMVSTLVDGNAPDKLNGYGRTLVRYGGYGEGPVMIGARVGRRPVAIPLGGQNRGDTWPRPTPCNPSPGLPDDRPRNNAIGSPPPPAGSPPALPPPSDPIK